MRKNRRDTIFGILGAIFGGLLLAALVVFSVYGQWFLIGVGLRDGFFSH